MSKRRFPGLLKQARMGIFPVALLVGACLPTEDRVAGGSTEAGNAGGKLSMSDGAPAADVSVALVARSYLPDTLAELGVPAAGRPDSPGAYYRTRTDAAGRYHFRNVPPGDYRVIAMATGLGATADSVAISGTGPEGSAGTEGETSVADQVLKPLGGIRGVVKIVGSQVQTKVLLSSKATLRAPSRSDSETGGFQVDSLPEGEYELVPQCFTCQPVKLGYRIKVKAGRDTLLADTLLVYPEYFYDFPDTGELEVRASWLPLIVGGKVNRGADRNGKPGSIRWDWNGAPLADRRIAAPDGVSSTEVTLDSTWFGTVSQGILRVTLGFSDTSIVRSWHVTLDKAGRVWPLSAVRVDRAEKIAGVQAHTWRFHVAGSLPLDYADVAFWGVRRQAEANQTALPEWLTLTVDNGVEVSLKTCASDSLSFILVPDSNLGGRVLRPRWNEALSDFKEIHYLETARLGFSDPLVPSMLPGGLVVDRLRSTYAMQRYRIDSSGQVEELLGPLPVPAQSDPLKPAELALFYRTGSGADGFAWNHPLGNAARAWAVTRNGSAFGWGQVGKTASLSAEEMESLRALLAPLAELPDTAELAGTGQKPLVYLWSGSRGLLVSPGSGGQADALLSELRAWLIRNGLEQAAEFPLVPGRQVYLGFTADTSGIRYTGDTLVAEASADGDGIMVREYLASGSPGKPADADTMEYRLRITGDSLAAVTGALPVASRLLGKLEGQNGVFALTGLQPVSPAFENGIPILSGGGNTLSGRLDAPVTILGRTEIGAGIWLDGSGIDKNIWAQGQGILYTGRGGVERAWRFGGRLGDVTGWDRL